MSESTIGIISLFTAAFLYGSQNIATRITGISFGPFLSTALRFAVVVVVLMWFVRWKKIHKADWKWFLSRSFSNVVTTTCIFIAVNKMSVGAALFSFYASMILSGAILGILFYKEKMTLVKAGSLVLTAIGLMLIYSNQSQLTFNWYFIVAVIGGTGAAFWSVFSRPLSHKYSLPQLVVLDSLIAGVMALIVSMVLHEPWEVVQPDARLIAIIYLGLTQVFTGQLIARGFKTVDAQVGSMIILNDSVVGMILVFFIFHEPTPLLVVLGGVCIFLSSLIPAVIEHKKNKK